MRRLLPTKEQRQISIIEYFVDHDNYATIDELEDHFDINPRTLLNDLDEITERVPYYSIEQVKRDVRLKNQQNCGLNEAYKEYLQQDLAFSILDELFREDTILINDLADNLYTSETSVYRAIKNINATLSEANFQFSIQLTPCKLIGKEEDIRRFFTNYYYESTSITEWPFRTIPQKPFFDALDVFLSKYEFNTTFALFFKASIILAVNIIRTQNGHVMERNVNNIAHSAPEFTEDIVKSFDTIRDIAWINELTSSQLDNLFYPCLDRRMIFNYANFVDKAFSDPFFNQSFLWLNNIIDTLKGELSFKVKNREILIVNLHNIAVIGSHMPGAYPILSKPIINLMEVVNEWSPDIFDLSHRLVADYLESVFNIIDTVTIDYVHYYLMTFWQDYTQVLTENTRNIKVLIISKYNASHLEFLKTWFQCNLTKQIDVDIHRDFNIDTKDLANSEWDIVVADFPIRGLDKKHFLQIPIVPEQMDLNELSTRISMVRHDIANQILRTYQNNASLFDYEI